MDFTVSEFTPGYLSLRCMRSRNAGGRLFTSLIFLVARTPRSIEGKSKESCHGRQFIGGMFLGFILGFTIMALLAAESFSVQIE